MCMLQLVRLDAKWRREDERGFDSGFGANWCELFASILPFSRGVDLYPAAAVHCQYTSANMYNTPPSSRFFDTQILRKHSSSQRLEEEHYLDLSSNDISKL